MTERRTFILLSLLLRFWKLCVKKRQKPGSVFFSPPPPRLFCRRNVYGLLISISSFWLLWTYLCNGWDSLRTRRNLAGRNREAWMCWNLRNKFKWPDSYVASGCGRRGLVSRPRSRRTWRATLIRKKKSFLEYVRILWPLQVFKFQYMAFHFPRYFGS